MSQFNGDKYYRACDENEKLETEIERLQHIINVLSVVVFNERFEEVNAIWEELAKIDESATARDAVLEWVKRKEVEGE